MTLHNIININLLYSHEDPFVGYIYEPTLNLNYFNSYILENNYAALFIYSATSLLLALVILFLNFIITKRTSTTLVTFEKLSSYECGFEPYGDAKMVFSFQYYVVAILFLIFDLELLFIFP